MTHLLLVRFTHERQQFMSGAEHTVLYLYAECASQASEDANRIIFFSFVSKREQHSEEYGEECMFTGHQDHVEHSHSRREGRHLGETAHDVRDP